HGWRGNTTDERRDLEARSAWQFLSVVLPRHPWALPFLVAAEGRAGFHPGFLKTFVFRHSSLKAGG
ncbi:MAG TPA: hypothetical protein VGH74_19315, partial [Planctomycetaceae bacterium]